MFARCFEECMIIGCGLITLLLGMWELAAWLFAGPPEEPAKRPGEPVEPAAPGGLCECGNDKAAQQRATTVSDNTPVPDSWSELNEEEKAKLRDYFKMRRQF